MSTQELSVEAQHIQEKALSTLNLGSQLLNKSYLAELKHFEVINVEDNDTLEASSNARIFHATRIVLDNKQSVLESATAAYTALGTAGYSVFFLIKSDGKETNLYLGTRCTPKQGLGNNAGKLLEQVIKGHFSGSELVNQDYTQVNQLLESLGQDTNTVTAVTGVPSLSHEEREHFTQGLEHFIDAAEGKQYQALILAEPISPQQLNLIREGYEQVATQLSPLHKQSISFGQNESNSVSLSLSKGISQSFGTSLSFTETKGTSKSHSITHGTNYAKTEGEAYNISTTGTIGASAALFGVGPNASRSVSIGYAKNISTTIGISLNEGYTEGTNETHGETIGENKVEGQSLNESQSNTNQQGTSRQITLESINKHIEQLLKRVDHQLERVEEARQYGAWHSAAYFISDNQAESEALASIFLGLIRGVNSSSEDFNLTTWTGSEGNKRINKERVLRWLQQLSHPRLVDDNYKETLGIPYFTPATLVSTKEMALQLGFPRRSTSAVTVIEAQTFGRKVQRTNKVEENRDRSIRLGNIYHLWQEMPHSPINLNIDQLTSHLFVTGSTGSGKSNTVYTLLQQLREKQVPFMVIEPAKGEYKHIFGHLDDVQVLGTNPKLTDLLRINPFRFPNTIHVLEHIDRLVEIFNVCWPMYAAMPAVLKDAMLRAYAISGWNLDTSENEFNPALYPSFTDLLYTLEQVIQESAFSEEVKSNYVGSLVTRVRSLTNGLNGQIFTQQEINNTDLFDRNIIIDLSRVGSQETKSLIMGILIMRLSEHRMAFSGMNQPLKHITVLEEAHNILKRTSTEQSSEGANVAGKAVEMLSNAIAEMRTYGEGFVIADQSPSAVDISAIRNTNTKIIMRLPDEDDRRLAGKSSGATDEQIDEIAKLPKGVAVVYQNDWLEPVLCQISKFNGEEKLYEYTTTPATEHTTSYLKREVISFLLQNRVPNPAEVNVLTLLEGLEKATIPNTIKVPILRAIKEYEQTGNTELWKEVNFKQVSYLITNLLDITDTVKKSLYLAANIDSNLEQVSTEIKRIIRTQLGILDKNFLQVVEESVILDFSFHNEESLKFYNKWLDFYEGKIK
ncbi:ATP-binding protein [Pelistega sp. NLN82]|uniref:ATP-binding protein n=1 Tax=Pelistega ratti TaxID=2652177 RepID=A0A6L9Y7E5_9BURK|nr:DUF87 domain-containing protein [Pelistega ratti]NEN76311.1 ATP-binding protein [Pelistega ratti]